MTSRAPAPPRNRPQSSGGEVTKSEATEDQFATAMRYEADIAARAAVERGDATTLSPELFLRLLPLLREPIPVGFIVETSKGTGKPYASKGIRSVQVQTDRMDNVLTPLWWSQEVTYHENGTLCRVVVNVHVEDAPVLREAWGGVDRGSTRGNLFKGSYTNAGKRAFALLGPGHEVYLGAPDFDPDSDSDAAKEQAAQREQAAASADSAPPIGNAKAVSLVDAAWSLGIEDKVPLAVAHVVGAPVGEFSSKDDAVKVVAGLSPMQGAAFERWLSKKAASPAMPKGEGE